MDVTLEFDHLNTYCPVCLSKDILEKSLLSNIGFMSVPGVWHSQCLTCGSYFVNPQPTEDSLHLFYRSNQTEDEVEEKILSSSVDRYFNPTKKEYFLNHRVKPIKKYLQPDASMIDIGCGAGTFVRFMKDEGFGAEGIDISKRSIEFGIRKLNLDNHLHVCHWNGLKQDNQTYDLVTIWTLLEHLKEPEELIKFTAEVLKAEGYLIIEVPTVDSLLFDVMKENYFWMMPPYHLFLFSVRGLKDMLNRNGFDVIEEYKMPSNWNFISSICKSLDIEYEFQFVVDSKLKSIFNQADKIFDQIAHQNGLNSTVQLICRLRK
ncbi:class I SAM-dependent methyltransferase [Paenibacillus sp. FSL H8-0034]|uniref:class I SAM-dependent methyltransferase n=1 Tax=Paenibacillus sp. FSL H8-0034 TaxID=2954671 RepID=UPI0030FD0756